MWSILFKTTQKFLQIHKKSKFHKQVSRVVAARSKAKAKPQQREPVDTTATIPMHERRWIDIEPSEQNLAAYDLSKKVISLLRHNQTVQREKDGAIEFYRIKFYLRNHSLQKKISLPRLPKDAAAFDIDQSSWDEADLH